MIMGLFGSILGGIQSSMKEVQLKSIRDIYRNWEDEPYERLVQYLEVQTQSFPKRVVLCIIADHHNVYRAVELCEKHDLRANHFMPLLENEKTRNGAMKIVEILKHGN
jgi:hypothetical protein